MPYTLVKGLVWILIALVLGFLIGWFMRSVTARRQVERARAHHLDTVEMERLRGRIANLEPVVAERDRLLADLDAARANPTTTNPTTTNPTTTTTTKTSAVPVPPAATGVPAAPDLAAAAAVLGHPIALDDLKVVEGVGPKIEALCHGIGIRTWFDLSITEVSLLRTMLADAGPRLRAHDPTTWPEQARLLAEGRWEEFRALNAGNPQQPPPPPAQ